MRIDKEQASLLWHQSKNERDRLLDLARDPSSTPDVLRRIVAEYDSHNIERLVSELAGSIGVGDVVRSPIINVGDVIPIPEDDDDPVLWTYTFYSALTANPNLPLDLYIRDLPLYPMTVAGLLQNPICPLLLLEHPDFIEMFPEKRQTMFIRLVLCYRSIPQSLLRALTCVRDPWLALEAQTHVANEESNDSPPDLAWLDRTVYELMRAEPHWDRFLPYELACHGLLRPEVAQQFADPWQDTEFQATLQELVPEETVAQCVREAQQLSGQGRKGHNQWWNRWMQELNRIHFPAMIPFRAVYAHSDVPYWVLAESVAGDRWHLEQILVIQHPDATPGLIRRCRRKALREALAISLNGYERHQSPIFYLAARDAPSRHVPRFFSRKSWWEMWLWRLPFLARLGIAFRLNDKYAYQRELRTLLLDDPNRYVRAAARKEIAWPGQTA